MNCDVLRLSDGTQKPSRPSAFWPTGRGISILTNQNSSMIDETDMWNHTHQHHRSRRIIPIISVHTLLTNILLSCCSCPLPGRRCCYHHLDDANQIGIKNCFLNGQFWQNSFFTAESSPCDFRSKSSPVSS